MVSAASLFDDKNKYAGSLAMITDVTKMKKAEAEIHEIEGRFKTVYNASPAAISISEINTGTGWKNRLNKERKSSILQTHV